MPFVLEEALAVLAVLTLAVISPAPSHGTPVPPYVFVLLDTSGSMSWVPPCTAAQFASFAAIELSRWMGNY